MKKWIGSLIVLLGLFLGSYFAMGFLVENTLHKNIDSLPQNQIIAFQLNNYKKGWFSSKADLALAVHIPQYTNKDQNGVETVQKPVDFDLSFPLIIKHGPVMLSDSGMQFGIGYITTQPQSHYHALINYRNHTLMNYSLPGFNFKGKQDDEEVQFEWLGMNAKSGITPKVDRLYGSFNLHGLSATVKDGSVKVGNINSVYDLKYNAIGLWLGELHFNVPLISVNEKGKSAFELGDLKITTGADISNSVLDYYYELSLNKLLINEKNYGPSALKLSIKNIDPQATADIMNQLRMKSFDNTFDSSIMLLLLAGEVPQLLSKGVELELSEFTINFPEGAAVGNFKVALPKNEVQDPTQMLKKAQGSGQFKAPKAVVRQLLVAEIESDLNKKPPQVPPVDNHEEAQKQADNTLKDLVDKTLIKDDGTNYVVDFKLENEHVFVNGQKMN